MRHGKCKKCGKMLEVYSISERIAELKFNYLLQKHYKKEHGINMFRVIVREKLRKAFRM